MFGDFAPDVTSNAQNSSAVYNEDCDAVDSGIELDKRDNCVKRSEGQSEPDHALRNDAECDASVSAQEPLFSADLIANKHNADDEPLSGREDALGLHTESFDMVYDNAEQLLPKSYTYSGASLLAVPKIPIRLFVQNIPKSYEKEDLEPLFTEFGAVEEVLVLKDNTAEQPAGSAFVRMASLTDADNAIANLSGVKVLDDSLGVLQVRYATSEIEKLGIPTENANPGVNQSRLFIGSLSRQADEDQIRSLFSTVCPVDEVYVIREAGTGLSRGCAFVVLATKEAALYAIKCLNGSEQLSASRPLEIRFAEIKSKSASSAAENAGSQRPETDSYGAASGNYGPATLSTRPSSGVSLVSSTEVNSAPRERDGWLEYFTDEGRPFYYNAAAGTSQWEKPPDFDTPGPPGANLFIFHVPSEWTLRELIFFFRPFGTIISATIATDKQTGRNRGYAFVSFTDIQSAVTAVKAMHGFSTGTKRLKVAIKQNEEHYAAHLMQAAQRPGYVMQTSETTRYPSNTKQYAAPY